MPERKIYLLDDKTINQIAAGEVIENGASVVKELIENALDAKAQNISVETKGNLIRISDDGLGMEEEDLPLAIQRHATSKIASIHDLDLLKSLGFRGEALASIASVSKLSILSSPNNSGIAYFFESHGGKEEKKKILSRQRGTTIEVSSLFYNVPVRKKFLKSDKAENGAILKVLTSMALCNPTVGFKWINQDKLEFAFEQEDFLLERIKVLLGEDFASSLFPVEQFDDSFSLKGFLSSPSYHRPNKGGQFLFINGRPVHSPYVSSKILDGYATRLPTSRFPTFVINLQMPSEWIDVNVHPQKKEVRFRNEEKMGQFLIRMVEKGLQAREKPTAVSFSPLKNFPSFLFSENAKEDAPLLTPPLESLPKPDTQVLFSFKTQVFAKFGIYLFVEKEGNFLLVDLKRARARIAFEGLKKKNSHSTQHLLMPLNLEFSEIEKMKLMDHLENLNEMGIGIRFFGNKTFIVDSIPQYLNESEVRSFLEAFLYGDKTHKEKAMASSMQKKIFTTEEAKLIVEMLFKCEAYKESPDGKQTFIVLTEDEIAKWFS